MCNKGSRLSLCPGKVQGCERAWPPPNMIDPVRKKASHQLPRQPHRSGLFNVTLSTPHTLGDLWHHMHDKDHILSTSQCSPPLYRHAMHSATGSIAMSHVDVQVPCRHTDIQALSSTCQRALIPLRCQHAQPGITDRVTGATSSSGIPPHILPFIAMRPCGRTRAAHGLRSRCADVARWSSPAQPAR